VIHVAAARHHVPGVIGGAVVHYDYLEVAVSLAEDAVEGDE
jgi:hypothetical protein